MSSDYDVITVGGGPVGQVAAILLGQRGHRVAIYEQWSSAFPLPRACSLGHEPARVLQAAGLGPELESLLEPVQGEDRPYIFQSAERETLLEIAWNKPGDSGWAEMSGFFQPDLEKLLADRIAALPTIAFERGKRVVAVTDGDEHALVSVVDHDDAVRRGGGEAGAHEVSARYVIGADGANSVVRTRVSQSLVDLGFEYDWLVVDVLPRDQDREWDPYFAQRIDPRRPTTSVPSGPGRRRWEFMLLPGESREEFATDEMTWRLLADWDVTPENAELVRSAVWTFRAMWVEEWRSGRLLLAGDAAHLMPPFLAQGLGSGLRDAAALAWRLDLILRDIAPDTVLDSYGPERIGHVQTIIREAVRLGEIICVSDAEAAATRDAQLREARRDPRLAPPPPPPWRVSPGLATAPNDELAGLLFVQGRVRIGVQTGLLEDLIGSGFSLVSIREDPAAWLGPDARMIWAQLEGRSVHVGDENAMVEDLQGTYASWFAERGVELILARPDFVIYGSGRSTKAGDDLVLGLGDALGIYRTATA
jgi:2-polyprenyl-6-methoxyphenol hydroxylase-like FAD-dependent oxidoreductase